MTRNLGISPTKLHFFALYQDFRSSQGVFQLFFNEIKGLDGFLHSKLTEKIVEN